MPSQGKQLQTHISPAVWTAEHGYIHLSVSPAIIDNIFVTKKELVEMLEAIENEKPSTASKVNT